MDFDRLISSLELKISTRKESFTFHSQPEAREVQVQYSPVSDRYTCRGVQNLPAKVNNKEYRQL